MQSFVGAYELLERVGVGGMGEVWRARHRTLGRLAAIKLVRPGALGGSSEQDGLILGRFEREARVAAALRSPHAISVLDFGATEDGRFYQVMELLDGLDLEALVERYGPQPPARVAALLRQACDALAEAHGLGLVHRDIKPSNLFLARSGTQVDFLKVLDFGLARPAGDADSLTQAGVVPGSPAYLPPEVIRGAQADGRGDVYALGCVAWWLLCGTLVFPARTSLEMIVGHLEREPGALPPGVPEVLADVVRDCLVKRPEGRPTARELSARLAATKLVWGEREADAWWRANLPKVGVAAAPGAASPAVSYTPPLGPIREEVSAALRLQFEQSRLDVSGLEERLSVASRGESPHAIRAALDGLPIAPPPELPVSPPPAPSALVPRGAGLAHPRGWAPTVTVFGNTTRSGPWQPEQRTAVVTVFGSAELDLRDAVLLPGMTEIRCVSVFGNATVIVPPELYVEVRGIGVLGSFESASGRARPPRGDRPWVRITGAAVFGSVEVQVRGTGRTALEDAVARGVEVVQTVVDQISDGAARGIERARNKRDRKEP